MKNLFIHSAKAIFFAVTMVIVMISSCKVTQDPIEELVTIDAKKAYNRPARDIMLSELVEDIEYVKLETGPDCLVGRGRVFTSENYIVFYDINTRKVLLFTKEGKYLNDIGSVGQGPGEYTHIFGPMTISPDEKHIILRHSWIWGWFSMYNIDGSFIKKFTIPPEVGPLTLGYFGPDNIVTITDNFASGQGFPDLFKTDNQLFIYDKEINLTDSLRLSYGDANMVTGKGFSGNAMYRYKGNIYLQQKSNDTIFRIDQTYSITPHLVIDLGGLKIPSQIVPGSNREYDYYQLTGFKTINNYDFIRLSGDDRWVSRNLDKYLVYNRISAETFFLDVRPDPYYKDFGPSLREPRLSIINDMDGVQNSPIPYSGENDSYINSLQIIGAKPYLESGAVNPKKLVTDKYYNELSKLLVESDIEDNPIIRIFHYK